VTREPQAFPKPTRTARLRADREEREREILARGQLRHDVLRRSGERCENPDCGKSLHLSGYVFDHWLGGSGRRKAEERIDTCWSLCRACNQDRTDNRPSADVWNGRYERHCARHHYRFIPHVTTTALDAFVGALRRST
jgi:hypothetical protein